MKNDFVMINIPDLKWSGQLGLAAEIAARAHAGQTDKAGVPYICHPIMVSSCCKDMMTKCVALLHDVLEDTDVTAEELLARGVAPEVVDAVRLLTHSDKGKQYLDYVRRIADSGNVAAMAVKYLDLCDNLGELRDRHGVVPPKRDKYLQARGILSEVLDGTMPMTENDILKICASAGYDMEELAYGGFAGGKHYVIYGQNGGEGEDVECTGAPIILVVQNGRCRVATDEELNYFYENLLKD